ncbi:MAG: Hsp20/alpha crystallin family protein, partial [Rhizobiales bacterium]|nr:Hsp20/alpha crystallin family protein [Hyphomicrobiales bacterium]
MTKHFLPDLFGRGYGGDLFSSLQKEIDQVFRDFGRSVPALAEGRDGMMPVKFNIAETDGAIEVTADIPGVDVKDIDVQLREGILTVRGEKKEEKDEKNKDYHLVERSYGMFERSFSLPTEVMGDKVNASFDKGVLKVVLPKAPAAQQKVQKIAVKA